jgi:hypothetical protein
MSNRLTMQDRSIHPQSAAGSRRDLTVVPDIGWRADVLTAKWGIRMIEPRSVALWPSLLGAERQLVSLRAKAFQADKLALIEAARASIADPLQRPLALGVLVWMEPEITFALLDDIIRIGARNHREVLRVRQLLGRLSRTKLARPVAVIVEKLLDGSDDDDCFRRLAELALHLGLVDTLRILANRGRASSNPHVREAAEDLLGEYISETSRERGSSR